MRILMIAPEPFFQPRGTPFSEYYRSRAFTELGHQVDMVTYPIGSDVSIPGLRVFRAARLPGIHKVKIGPSWAKVPLDLMVFLSAVRRLVTNRYDLLDCHEEAGLMGIVLSRLFRVPTLYDMHSSLPEQLSNFGYSHSAFLRYLFSTAERWTIRGSNAVIVICPHLAEIVRQVDPELPTYLIENSPLAESGEPATSGDVVSLRRSLALGDAPIVLYTGTFEAYQGFELLFRAFRVVADNEPCARLLMVGGHPEQVGEAGALAKGQGIAERVVFTGQRPPSDMPRYLAVGDVLVSPRSSGTNTPLKIYSYLRAGKPIVATRLLTHTQVLDDEVALLTEPEPRPFGEGILTLLRDRERARRLGAAARARAEQKYSYARYLENTQRVLDFFAGVPSTDDLEAVSSKPPLVSEPDRK